MKIGIAGYGFVGKATHYAFQERIEESEFLLFDPSDKAFEVRDFKPQRWTRATKLWQLANCDFVFVCVPTPTNFQRSTQDLSIVDMVICELAPLMRDRGVLVVKTTTLPGTTQSYIDYYPNTRIVFNPEFLVEANYLHDALNQSRIVVGGPDEPRRSLEALYRMGWPDAAYYVDLDSTQAEMVKYGGNCFLAVKVAYFNEIAQICGRLGCNYEGVREAISGDSRIMPNHTKVPGPDGMYGFGGKCFPKDIVALMGLASQELILEPSVMWGAWRKNMECRREHDWDHIEGATSDN